MPVRRPYRARHVVDLGHVFEESAAMCMAIVAGRAVVELSGFGAGQREQLADVLRRDIVVDQQNVGFRDQDHGWRSAPGS